MKNLTVFVAFSLLVAFACAQGSSNFDFRPRVGDRISLGGVVRDSNNVNSVKTGTVEEQEIFACEKVTHAVSSVSTNNPLNSGSKFQVHIDIIDGTGSLSVTFGTPGQTESFEIHEQSVVTDDATNSPFFYYCENYPSSSTLEVLVEADGSNTLPIVYNLTVTQYESVIRTIPASRTLRQTSSVLNLLEEEDDAEEPDHVAGQDFVHYYHKLVPTLSESRSTAFIVVDNWNWEATSVDSEHQTAYVCVSFTSLVMWDGTPSAPDAFTYTDAIDTTDPVLNDSPCDMWCVSREIVDADNEIRFPIGSCDEGLSETPICGLPENIWIGIIPPSPVERSTYDINIVFEEETLSEVLDLPAGNGLAQGFLVDDCQSDDMNPCRDYYDISDPPSGTSGQFGPYLSVELFAVNNGEVEIDLYDGHIEDGECGCTPALTPGCRAGDTGNVPLYCTDIIHPCNYDRNIDYTLVVSSIDGSALDSEYSIEYALNTFVGNWPLEPVTASSFNKPSFGTIKPRHYHHYEINFTADQISPSSYFQTELYSLHEENSLEFFWRFGEAAGRTTECYGYDGKCSTHSDCDLEHDDPQNNGHCRFLFVPCDAEAGYSDYAEYAWDYDGPDDPTDQTTKYGGLKVSKLQAGKYYFAVRGNDPTDDPTSINVKNEYTYTITWNLQEEIQVFDGVPVPNSVYYLDYSQQYVFNLPKTDSLYRLRIRTSYVFNGFVDTTVSCDAGFCACGGVSETVNTGLHTLFNEANDGESIFSEDNYFFGYSSDIHFDPTCRGCKDKIYITVRGALNDNPAVTVDPAPFSFPMDDSHKPTPYVLTVHIEPFSKVPVPILSASRAGYHHNDEIKRAADSVDLHLAFEETYDEWTKFYKVSFANAEDFRNDAFLVDLTIVPGVSALKGLVDFYFGSPSASLEIHTLNDCTVHGLCFAGTYPGDDMNFNGEIPPFAETNFEDGISFNWSDPDNRNDVTQGSCRVALQPCSLDSCANTSPCGNTEDTFVEDFLPDLEQPYRTTAFDRNLEYYIVVRDWSHPTALFLGYPDFPIDALMGVLPRIVDDLTNVFFKLSLQVLEQTPLPLIVDQPVYGHVGAKQYVHFRYEVGNIPANSKLVFTVYRNHNEEENLFFYMNHWDGTGPEVWAGESFDCLATSGCPGRCELSKEGDKDVCTFEVSPCDLKSKTGTYFLSVSSGTLDYVWGSSTFGVHEIDFTISATHIPPIELLGTNKIEGVERGLLSAGSSLYYSVTVPRLSSGVIGRVMNVELENIQNGDVEVIVSRDAPEDQCGCSSSEVYTAAEDSIRHVLRRTSCQVDDTSTFYITVTGISEEEDCGLIGFVLRAFVFDVTQRQITLTTDSEKVTGFSKRILRFDSDSENNAQLNEFTIREQEIVALTWRTSTSNAPQGSVMEISIEHDGSETVPVTLGAGSFIIPVPSAGVDYDGSFGPAPDVSNCPVQIWGDDLSTELSVFVDACQFPNTNTDWYLLFSGEALGAESGVITVRIRVVPPENLVDVPATSNFDDPGVETGPSEDLSADEVDLPIERRVFISDPLGLSAGQSVRFDFNGASNVVINYNSETNVDSSTGCPFVCEGTTCTISACENLQARPWYFAVEASGPVSFTVTRIDKSYEDSTTSSISLSANSERSFSLSSDTEWQYFRVSIPAATDTAYRIYTDDVTSAGVTLYMVDSTFIMPGQNLPGDVVLSGDGIPSIGQCGVVTAWVEQANQCCYDQLDLIFAATGATVEDVTIELQTASLQGSTGSLSFGSNSRTVGGTGNSAWKPTYFTFNVPENTGFFYEFAVPDDATSDAQFYLGRTRAGQEDNFNFETNPPVYAVCYDDSEIVNSDTLSPGNSFNGFVDPCDAGSCSGGQWVLSVVPVNGDGRTEFTYTLAQAQVETRDLRGSANVNLNTNWDGANSPDDFIEYKYDFTTVNNNWLPIQNEPLFGSIDDYHPPRLVFQVDNLRVDSVDATDFNDVSFYLDTASSGCGVPATNNFDSACESEVDPPEDTLRCAKSFCDVPCGTSFYLKAHRQDQGIDAVPVAFRYSTSIVNAVSISDVIDIQTVAVSRNSVSRRWRSDGRSAVYFKTTFNLEPNSWVNVIVSNYVATDADGNPVTSVPEIERFLFDGNTCYGSSDQSCTLALVTPEGVDTPCILRTDPEDRCTQAESDFTQFPVYYRVGFDSPVVFGWSFDIDFEVQTITPLIDAGSQTTLESGESYTKTKFIPEDSWQFYTFNLVPELGYDHFNFEVTVDGCGDGLEVYTSWSADGVVHDWVRSNKWPVNDGCSADFEDGTITYTNNLPSCHTFGGEYRVAIYAPEGSASIPGGDIVYTISAELVNVPHVDLDPYCKHSQQYNVDFVSRYEFLVDASNRGSQLTFHFATENEEDYTLWISKNANPYPSSSAEETSACDWVDEPGLYSLEFVSGDGEVSLSIDICEFENDVWYLYVAGPEILEDDTVRGPVTVWATLETQYIPVAELAGETDLISWSATLLDGASQTYKVLLNQPDSDFLLFAQLNYPDSECSTVPEGCSLDLTYSTGSVGYVGVPDDTLENPRVCDGCGECEDCGALILCQGVGTDGSTPCFECVPNTFTEYFFTVHSTGNCPYVLEVSLLRAETGVTLAPGDDLCIEVLPEELSVLGAVYEIPATISKVTITSESLFTVVSLDGFSCGGAARCENVSPCVIENGLCENLVIAVNPADIVCGFKYGIVAEAAAPVDFVGQLVPITLGRAVEAESEDYATYTVTSPVTFVNPEEVFSYSTSFGCGTFAGCGAAGDNVVLTAVDGEPTTYYFSNPQGLILTAAGSATPLTASGANVDFDDADIKHFEISIPSGVTSYSIVLSELTVDADNLGFGHSVSGLPFTSCYCGFAPENEVTAATGECDSEIVFDFSSCSEERTHWFSVSNCVSGCAARSQGFRIRVVFDEETQLPVVSGNHNTAYTVLESSQGGCGEELVSAVSYVVEVTDILSVSLRNSHQGESTITVSQICGDEESSCSVASDDYASYSCRVNSGCEFDPFSCYPPGFYEVTVTLPADGYSNYVEFLVVNQWVALTSSADATIFGAEKHFYSLNAPESLSVSLSISSGPALKFIVFDGCDLSEDGTDPFSGFSESQVCASDCNIWIPTKAKHSGKSTYYIEIESKSIDVDIPQFVQNQNFETEKGTRYTISTKLGTGNCAAPPSSGFCASTEFEGINVWSSITGSSVWSFIDPVSKDNEARCRFESYLTEGCGVASTECRSWLKVYSCLTSFPQCDASGFQTGICTDVCSQVRDHCGIDFGCCSDQFVDSVEGSTCYDIPPPPPPTTVSELPELEGDLGFDEFPPSLETPVFSTIQVYLPPADELFENIPLLKEAIVGEEISPAAVIIPGFIFCIFFVIGLF